MKFKNLKTRWSRYIGTHANRQRQPVMLCGLDYEHYRIQTLVKQSAHYELVAWINDFPWNHGTLIEAVRVYYPSEAPSLAKRHGVTRLLYHSKGDLAVFDDQTLAALEALKVKFHSVNPQQLENLDDFLSKQD